MMSEGEELKIFPYILKIKTMAPFPKILIAAPTSANKNYCLEKYLLAVNSIVYPNWKLVLFDNTTDNGENTAFINSEMKRFFGEDDRFLAIHSDIRFCNGVISRVCKGHNDCRDYAIKNNFDYMFHLETDVIAKPHVLQELLLHKKTVIGALYYRDHGRFRRLMLQQRIFRGPHNIFSANMDKNDDLFFVDGTVKPASHIGLGAVLIKIDVLKKTPFRFIHNIHCFPDSYFAEDLYKKKIKIWADTSLILEHINQDWETEVLNKNNKAI